MTATRNRPRQSLRQVRLEHLVGHADNRALEAERVAEMAGSMREHGVMQPLVVTEHPTEPDRWLILDGHHRASAASRIGRTLVPCIVRHSLDDDLDEQLIVMLVANCQRATMSPIDRAERFEALRHRGMTLAEISRRTGIAEATVSKTLGLLDLAAETRERVRRGELTAKAASEAVTEVRQQRRAARGHKLQGRPAVTEPAHFSRKHPLAAVVRASCTHTRRPIVGTAGCGQCWEAAIRADATTVSAPGVAA